MPSSATYPPIWNRVLASNTTEAADLIASLHEQTINHYLEQHFKYDWEPNYSLKVVRTFDVHGTPRRFTLEAAANKPLRIDLPPFKETLRTRGKETVLQRMFREGGGWQTIETPDPRGPVLHTPSEGSTEPNVRAFCPELQLKLSWPRLGGGKPWEWEPDPIAIIGEAYISLHHEAVPGSDEIRHYLRLQPTKIKFEKATKLKLGQALQTFLATLPAKERALIQAEDDKFNDLLLILLNIVSTQFAPQLLRTVDIPSPVVANKPLTPTVLDLGDDCMTFGLSLDRGAIQQANDQAINSMLERFLGHLDEDIESYGGLRGLVAKPRQPETRPLEELELYSEAEISRRLKKASAYVAELQKSARPQTSSRGSRARAAGSVKGGFGVGVDEYFFDTLAADSMPKPKEACTRWLTVVAVRGRACHWSRIHSPDVTIQGTKVSGSVQVDLGGAVEACVLKFWDCSWRWACAKLSIAVKGRPGIELSLRSGSGIEFYGKLRGKLRLETNLPFPFNKILSAVSSLIWEALKAIINAVASQIRIVIVPPEIPVPGQETKLNLTGFAPFAYQRPTLPNLPPNKRPFIGYAIDVKATN